MPRRFCKRARPRGAPPLPPVRAPSGRAAALPSPHPARASLPPLPPVRAPLPPLPPVPTAAVRPHASRPRAAPPLPSVPAAAVRPCPIRTRRSTAISTSRPHAAPPLPSVRMPPRRCRPSVPHPDAPQHCHLRIPSARRSTPALTFHPRAAARPPSHSVHAPPLRERAAPPGWHPRHPHAVAVIRPRRASVYRRGMAQDGTVPPRLSIPARRHGRSTLCFCALANYHGAVLTNARPPCYAEASAGRGRSATPAPCRGKRTGGWTFPQTPRPPRETNQGGRSATPAPCRRGRTGGGRSRTPAALPRETNRDGRSANPAPAAPRSPRGAPEGNGSPPKTNGLRARHRAAGGKEAACSASSCPRCARWRR